MSSTEPRMTWNHSLYCEGGKRHRNPVGSVRCLTSEDWPPTPPDPEFPYFCPECDMPSKDQLVEHECFEPPFWCDECSTRYIYNRLNWFGRHTQWCSRYVSSPGAEGDETPQDDRGRIPALEEWVEVGLEEGRVPAGI